MAEEVVVLGVVSEQGADGGKAVGAGEGEKCRGEMGGKQDECC